MSSARFDRKGLGMLSLDPRLDQRLDHLTSPRKLRLWRAYHMDFLTAFVRSGLVYSLESTVTMDFAFCTRVAFPRVRDTKFGKLPS